MMTKKNRAIFDVVMTIRAIGLYKAIRQCTETPMVQTMIANTRNAGSYSRLYDFMVQFRTHDS